MVFDTTRNQGVMPAATRWGDKAIFDPSIYQFPRSLGLSRLVTMAILEVWPGHSFPWSSEEYSWHSQTTRAPVKRKGSSSFACIEIHDVYHRDHNMVIIIVILINHRGNVAGNLPRHSSHQPGPRAPSVRSNLIMMTIMMMMMMSQGTIRSDCDEDHDFFDDHDDDYDDPAYNPNW